MAFLNKVELIGRLGQKPVLNTTNTNNVPVSNLNIAVNEEWKDKTTGEKRTKTTWMTVVCYKKLAQLVVEHLDKGRLVYISGRLEKRKFGGQTNYAGTNQRVVDGNGQPILVERDGFDIVATDVQFLDSKQTSTTAYQQPVAQQPVVQQPVAQPPQAGNVQPQTVFVAAPPAAQPVPVAAPAAPVAQQPVVQQPVVQQPVVQQPTQQFTTAATVQANQTVQPVDTTMPAGV